MIDGVLDDAGEQGFVRVGAAGNLFRKIGDGKIADFFFEQVATLVPAGDKVVPGDGRLGPFLFGLPTRHGIAFRGVSHSFIPKQQMLKQSRNGMNPGSGRGWVEARRAQEGAQPGMAVPPQGRDAGLPDMTRRDPDTAGESPGATEANASLRTRELGTEEDGFALEHFDGDK